MVVISLYRGKLHKVPDVPRKWLMPQHSISLRDFRKLLQKRRKALSLLQTNNNKEPANSPPPRMAEGIGDNAKEPQHTETPPPLSQEASILHSPHQNKTPYIENPRNSESIEVLNKPAIIDVAEEESKEKVADEEKLKCQESASISNSKFEKEIPAESAKKVENPQSLEEKVQKKKDLEKKLHRLNEEKHNLVQLLKRILNDEEEMKKRNSIQMSGARAPNPLQVETTVDMGSLTRQASPRVGTEPIVSSDLEMGECEDATNPTPHTRSLHHICGISPSTGGSSIQRLPQNHLQNNPVSQTTRTSAGHNQTASNYFSGVSASPSRFAPMSSGIQTHHSGNPPLLSVSGAITTSLPSPAATSGTPFRDSRAITTSLPSPAASSGTPFRDSRTITTSLPSPVSSSGTPFRDSRPITTSLPSPASSSGTPFRDSSRPSPSWNRR
ncbi:hypothetical protein AMTRI_Chr03g53110 [Amborella trichopoda]